MCIVFSFLRKIQYNGQYKSVFFERGKLYKIQFRLHMILDRIALILSIIGALNWGSIGLFKFDVVAWICGGQTAVISRIIYVVVALAGIWCISLLFRPDEYRVTSSDRD